MQTKLNGHHVETPPATPLKASNAVHPIEVFRCEQGQTVHVRMLNDTYGGLFTHYVRGKSIYCQGKDCLQTIHRGDTTWKGYTAVEVWIASREKWQPWVLEITECLEQDFRGRFKRGQVWEIFREMPIGKKKQPVTGKLHEMKDPSTFPLAFDIRPVVMRMYHIFQVDLTHKNPLPPRIVLSESDGDEPAVLQKPEQQPGEREPLPFDSFADELSRRNKTPTEKKNSRGY